MDDMDWSDREKDTNRMTGTGDMEGAIREGLVFLEEFKHTLERILDMQPGKQQSNTRILGKRTRLHHDSPSPRSGPSGGVYIVRLDEESIKIGTSKNMAKRVKQYSGY